MFLGLYSRLFLLVLFRDKNTLEPNHVKRRLGNGIEKKTNRYVNTHTYIYIAVAEEEANNKETMQIHTYLHIKKDGNRKKRERREGKEMKRVARF